MQYARGVAGLSTLAVCLPSPQGKVINMDYKSSTKLPHRTMQSSVNRDETVTQAMPDRPIAGATEPVEGSCIAMSVITTRYTLVRPDVSGHETIGEMIDRLLVEASRRGERVQTVSLHVTDADWKAITKESAEFSRTYISEYK